MRHAAKLSAVALHALIALSIATYPLSNALESDSIASNATVNGTSTETRTMTITSTSYSTRSLTTTTSSYSLSTQKTTTASTSTTPSRQNHTHTTTTTYATTYSAISGITYNAFSNSSFNITSSTASGSTSTTASGTRSTTPSENMSSSLRSRTHTSSSRTSSSRTASSTSRSTISFTSSSFSSTSSSSYTISSTTAPTTSTATMTKTVTTETVTVTHTVQLKGKIELSLSSARSFTESLQVEKSARRALAQIMFVNVQFIEVMLQLKSGQRRLQTSLRQDVSQGLVDLSYEVVIPFHSVEAGTLSRARMAIIQATPRQIARVLEAEVNSDSPETYRIEVVEVFPPTLMGSGESRTTLAVGTTARGILSDTDYSLAFQQTLSVACLVVSTVFSAAAPSFAAG
eukprot:TRINITY_DN41871_c0_g1_i1.p1 TRINITY_DN41871_c0_g1~~TRINITY_DN41871_c0_g1_i1.p1  ORF type:complete len:402 (-),score=37.13 TRINITY_DN41871_c0_g1_i1:72-1277(-)